MRRVDAVVPGLPRPRARKARPDLHIVGPLLERIRGAAIELREEDAIDRGAVDADVRTELIGGLKPVDRHPDAPVARLAPVPERLELEPSAHRYAHRSVVHAPVFLAGKAAVGVVVCPDLPVRLASIGHDRRDHPVVAGAFPLEYDVPAVDELLQQVGLELAPKANVKGARLARRPYLVGALRPALSLRRRPGATVLLDEGMERARGCAGAPGDGLDVVDDVVRDGRRRRGSVG